MNTKSYNKCKEIKILLDFIPSKKSKDGRQGTCMVKESA